MYSKSTDADIFRHILQYGGRVNRICLSTSIVGLIDVVLNHGSYCGFGGPAIVDL